jgi:uncharacterized membrane protein
MSSPRSVRKLAVSLAMFAVVALGSAVAANADQVVINVPNPGLSGTPGPYATVTYTLNGSVIDVTVQMEPGFTAFGTGNFRIQCRRQHGGPQCYQPARGIHCESRRRPDGRLRKL